MILISINPEHCKNIFNGIKTIEWRTMPLPMGRDAVYCTKEKSGKIGKPYQDYEHIAIWSKGFCPPSFVEYGGKVIGEFTIVRAVKYATVDEIPESVITAGCVSKEFLQAYSKGKPIYANYIENVRLYDKPKELGEFKKVSCEYCNDIWCDADGRCTRAECTQIITHAPQSYMRIETPDWAKEEKE